MANPVKLTARISRSDIRTIRRALEQVGANGSVRKAADEFVVEARLTGASTARDLNRALLSALRTAERRATLRAEWTAADNTTERYFDYVLKKTFGP
jgi:ribosomal protein S20